MRGDELQLEQEISAAEEVQQGRAGANRAVRDSFPVLTQTRERSPPRVWLVGTLLQPSLQAYL